MQDSPIDDELRLSFLGTLMEDVLVARARRDDCDSQTHRREVIRTIFAAIEGSIWLYRQQVRSMAKSMGLLTPVADLALQERSFSVTDRGTIIEQVKFITLPTIIKLTNRQAKLIDPELSLDFGSTGWSALKDALSARHRITHPKSREDLHLGNDDMARAEIAFSWINDSILAALTATTAAFRTHATEMRTIVDALLSGDKGALSEYRAALAIDEDD
ncbi:hypothetical protein FSB78_12915 [Sphingomonas ginsenosidivorax]|uniref:MAE-28990/MAE-18760-like HEPN domain-containing protein n=1 Tax=Sphingomonas ginsenosidivorax TaxID=862135 RepID=A0A5C6UIF6_9SPHN|nr:hypothetical protein [Sphingomonas ginsenosidivorax]TXC71748.1 hypothetical protein FSB78_12915 [Sphingomonas ginsenosidivorax]